MNKLSRVGIDLAKNVFQIHGVDRNEKTVWRRRLKRDNWLKVLLEKVEPGCVIAMEGTVKLTNKPMRTLVKQRLNCCCIFPRRKRPLSKQPIVFS